MYNDDDQSKDYGTWDIRKSYGKSMPLPSDESDYITENEYSVPEDLAESSDEQNVFISRTGGRIIDNPQNYSSSGKPKFSYRSVNQTDNEVLNSETSFSRPRTLEYRRQKSFRRAMKNPRTSIRVNETENMLFEAGSSSYSEERNTAIVPKQPVKRGKLIKQTSIVPIITDSSGAMKMTFWM